MSFPTGSANPYEAPTVDMSPVSLAEDTEFLFNDKVIAGIGKISLPNVCVVSGDRTNLVRRETCFRWCSRWLTIPGNILIGLVIVSIFQLLPIGTQPPGGGGWKLFYLLPALMGAGSAVGVACFSVLGRLLGQPITVEWSISAGVLRKIRRIWIVGTFIILGDFILTAIFAPPGQNYWGLSLLFAMAIGSTMLSFASAAGYRPLRILGRHEGLLLIGGFREPFLVEVQRLAAMRSSRESGTVPKPD